MKRLEIILVGQSLALTTLTAELEEHGHQLHRLQIRRRWTWALLPARAC
jgi:hypothetical protein